MTDSPLVYAHRGSSAALPEHTLAAYLRAINEGADGLECDVRLTRDGHLVCVHDRRLERTSNGRGRVSGRTLAELDSLDFGSWHPGLPAGAAWRDGPAEGGPAAAGPGSPESAGLTASVGSAGDDPPDPDRVRLLTLDRLLGAVRDAGRQVRLLIETKHPTRYGSEVERRLVDLLHRYDLAEPRPADPIRVTVMSFSPLAVRHVHALAPALPTVLLLELLPPGVRLRRLPFGTRIAGPSIGLVRARPALVPALRDAGNQVYVWTVNAPRDIDLVIDYGVDGIITDRPRAVLDRLGR
jgi:glycerophosphoryl diester phosphodiesterase